MNQPEPPGIGKKCCNRPYKNAYKDNFESREGASLDYLVMFNWVQNCTVSVQ